MDDNEILKLFAARDEAAIRQTRNKYGKRLYAIALRILTDPQEAKECENGVYAEARNGVPPLTEGSLYGYCAAQCRRLAIDRLLENVSEKKGKGTGNYILEELYGAFPEKEGEGSCDKADLKALIETFLKSLPETERALFIRRYWYFCTVAELSEYFGMKDADIRTALSEVRKKAAEFFKNEGYGT